MTVVTTGDDDVPDEAKQGSVSTTSTARKRSVMQSCANELEELSLTNGTISAQSRASFMYALSYWPARCPVVSARDLVRMLTIYLINTTRILQK